MITISNVYLSFSRFRFPPLSPLFPPRFPRRYPYLFVIIGSCWACLAVSLRRILAYRRLDPVMGMLPATGRRPTRSLALVRLPARARGARRAVGVGGR